MEKSKKDKQEWIAYRKLILIEKSKSDDDFEKYITFIASGSLALTLTFIDKISPLKQSTGIWIIVLGWFLLAATLFINLLSHYLSSRYSEKTIQDIDDDLCYEDVVIGITKRNKIISNLNLWSIILLGLGISFVLIFTTVNAYNNG
jgi:hypothetical protein